MSNPIQMPNRLTPYSMSLFMEDPIGVEAGLKSSIVSWDPRWRKGERHRTDGGRRRTFLPQPQGFSDRLLVGGSKKFTEAIGSCVTAAEVIMKQKIGFTEWSPTRIVIQSMPAGMVLGEHPDPDTYDGGTMVASFGEARVTSVNPVSAEETVHETSLYDFMYIPAGHIHKIENGDAPRISVVMAQDSELAAGSTFLGQAIADRTRHYGRQVIAHLDL